MITKYAGICFRCGERVPVEAGVMREWNRDYEKAWFAPGSQPVRASFLIEHKECAERCAGATTHYLWNPLGKT
jgi:hypothetical protein